MKMASKWSAKVAGPAAPASAWLPMIDQPSDGAQSMNGQTARASASSCVRNDSRVWRHRACTAVLVSDTDALRASDRRASLREGALSGKRDEYYVPSKTVWS